MHDWPRYACVGGADKGRLLAPFLVCVLLIGCSILTPWKLLPHYRYARNFAFPRQSRFATPCRDERMMTQSKAKDNSLRKTLGDLAKAHGLGAWLTRAPKLEM